LLNNFFLFRLVTAKSENQEYADHCQ